MEVEDFSNANRIEQVQVESQPAAAFLRARLVARSMMSHKTASKLGDDFAKYVPRPLQRICETYFDFPVSSIMRASKVLLIRVPKAASVSLSMQIYGRISHVPHRSALFYMNSDPDFFFRSLSFAVLRDPLERAESAFRWLKSDEFKTARPNPQTRRSLSKIESYESFVMDYIYPAFKAGRLDELDPVLHRQCDYVCDENGAVIVGRLFKLDQMRDIQMFLAKNGISASERKDNRSDGRALTEQSRAIDQALRTIYSADLSIIENLKIT